MVPSRISQHNHAALVEMARLWGLELPIFIELVATGEVLFPGSAFANTGRVVSRAKDMLVWRADYASKTYVIKHCEFTPDRASQVRIRQRNPAHRKKRCLSKRPEPGQGSCSPGNH
jgi:hypothetical protein